MTALTIVADENMPAIAELFGEFGRVITLPGRRIDRAAVAGADVLLVRSVTVVNRTLLAGSAVKFVGSATIGTDHVDTDYLAERGIAFAHAPGCNARAVADYMTAVLCACEPGWRDKTLGIVGCGNVGGGLYRRLKALGVDCRCYDPFLDERQVPDLTTFEAVLEADVLCLHAPLTRSGPYPTRHLFDEAVLRRLRPGTLLINAGRGAVVDNRALLARLGEGALRAVLDVWENEPDIDPDLLERVALGTPHIAGYSLEGRLAGTRMVLAAFCRWRDAPLPPPAPAEAPAVIRVEPGATLASVVLSAYDPRRDGRHMRHALADADGDRGAAFDRLRKHYPVRREFSHFRVRGRPGGELLAALKILGFRV
jgi:erythronate-4-phosphate dehydrogenase